MMRSRSTFCSDSCGFSIIDVLMMWCCIQPGIGRRVKRSTQVFGSRQPRYLIPLDCGSNPSQSHHKSHNLRPKDGTCGQSQDSPTLPQARADVAYGNSKQSILHAARIGGLKTPRSERRSFVEAPDPIRFPLSSPAFSACSAARVHAHVSRSHSRVCDALFCTAVERRNHGFRDAGGGDPGHREWASAGPIVVFVRAVVVLARPSTGLAIA